MMLATIFMLTKPVAILTIVETVVSEKTFIMSVLTILFSMFNIQEMYLIGYYVIITSS